MNLFKRTGQVARFRWVPALAVALALVLPASAQRSADEIAAPEPIELVSLAEQAVPLAYDNATWESFSDVLVDALGGDNDSFRAAALRLVIQYASDVSVDDAIFDLVRLYRDHPNERMRRMAVVAIGSVGHEWGVDMLRRSVPFEKSEAVKHTLVNVLAEIDAGVFGPSLTR